MLGTGKGDFTDVFGSLVVLDAGSGEIVRRNHDYWQVYSLALSADGRWVAASEHPDTASGEAQPGDADRIRILDLDTGAERCRYAGVLPSVTRALTFSPDDRSVAAIGDQTVLVFDAASGAERWRTRIEGAFEGIAWSPDSATVAVGGLSGVVILDGQVGSQRVLASSPSAVHAVAQSPDGARLVAGCGDGTIRAFAASDGAEAWSAPMNASAVASLAVSADGRWVAGLSRDRVLAVLDLRSGSLRYPAIQCDFPGDGSRVLFSPTLRHILAMDFISRTSVIDARTGRLAGSCPGRTCLIPPDGGALAMTGFFVVERYDLGVAISEHDIGARITSLAMSPAGTPLVAVADTDSAVTVVAAASGVRLARKPIPGTIAAFVFADGGQAVAAGGSRGVRLFSILADRAWKDETITPVNALAVSGTAGEWIATAAGKTVHVLRSADGQSRWPAPSSHPQTVTRIAASDDGRWIGTGCADRKTRILDAGDGRETFSVEGDGKVRALAFQPGGSLLGTGNEDGNVILIDAATATERSRVARLLGCAQIAFSFDGTMLAIAWDDNTVAIYDLTASGSPPKLRELAYTAPIAGLAFSPADNTLAIATSGAPMAIYDPHSGIELVRILRPAPASLFAFGAGGDLIATASDDGVVRVWASGASPTLV